MLTADPTCSPTAPVPDPTLKNLKKVMARVCTEGTDPELLRLISYLFFCPNIESFFFQLL